MWAGLLGITPTTSWAAVIAAGMVALNLYVLWRLLRRPEPPSLSSAVLGVGVLCSQLLFWVGTAYYIEVPTVGGFVIFALMAQIMMVPFGLWFASLVFEVSERPVSVGAAWTWTLALLVLGNEVFMSWAFAALVPGSLPSAITSFASAGHALLTALSSPWYYWPMGVTMVVLIRGCHFEDEQDRQALYALSATAFVTPWVFDVPIAGAISMAAIMSGGIYILWRGTQFTRVARASLILRGEIGAAFLAMGMSWMGSYFFLPGDGFAPFAAVMVVVMFLETLFLVRRLTGNGYGGTFVAAVAEPASASPANAVAVGSRPEAETLAPEAGGFAPGSEKPPASYYNL